MSYSEILSETTERIRTQFKPHAVLAIGQINYIANATTADVVLPAFSCLATDICMTTHSNCSNNATALACSVRIATIAVDGNGIPTLTVTLSAAVPAGQTIVENYVILRAAN
jgi:hypothetical protein